MPLEAHTQRENFLKKLVECWLSGRKGWRLSFRVSPTPVEQSLIFIVTQMFHDYSPL